MGVFGNVFGRFPLAKQQENMQNECKTPKIFPPAAGQHETTIKDYSVGLVYMNPVIERSIMRGGVATFRHGHFLETLWKPQTSIYFLKAETKLYNLHTTFFVIPPLSTDLQPLTGQNSYFFLVRVPIGFGWGKSRQYLPGAGVWTRVAEIQKNRYIRDRATSELSENLYS